MNHPHAAATPMLEALGGEAGCKRLSEAFYRRVAADSVLRPLFPGKSQKCAIEEMAAFLIQFLGGDEAQTQRRWWLSLRESHARFRIAGEQRGAWLKHMAQTLASEVPDEAARAAMMQFFDCASTYVIGAESAAPGHQELAARWSDQQALDEAIAAIASGRDRDATASAPRYSSRPSVYLGLLVRMMQSEREPLLKFALEAVAARPPLIYVRFAGRTMLHYAAGAGCLPMVELLLAQGMDANVLQTGNHTPLYCVANECASHSGPLIVRALVRAGAELEASDGVSRSTPLHMAARRGHVELARVLIEFGARKDARDRKGDTPLQRALNCKKMAMVELLRP